MWNWKHDQEFVGLTPGLVPADGGGEVRRIRRAKEWSGTVAVRFEPPTGISPGLAGTVVDGRVDPRDIGAMMIDLALRGWYVIGKRDGEWVFTLTDPAPAVDNQTESERLLMSAMFARGQSEVALGAMKKRLRGGIRKVRDQVNREVVEHGWYAKPPHRTGLSRVRGRVPRTALGTATRIQTLGFEKYLATAEAREISFEEAAGRFSRYLPYAMIFGLADRWASVMSEVFRKARFDGMFDGGGSSGSTGGEGFSDPMFWFYADDLADLGLQGVSGLADLLSDADGLLDLGGLVGELGDVFSDLGDVLGGIFDALDIFS